MPEKWLQLGFQGGLVSGKGVSQGLEVNTIQNTVDPDRPHALLFDRREQSDPSWRFRLTSV